MRVSIEATSPAASALVGVWMRGARSPTLGTGSAPGFMTVRGGPAGVAATRRSSSRATPSTSYLPGLSKGMSAT
jgi:hypothetical protein